LGVALPKLSREAALLNSGNPSHSVQLDNLRRAADSVKVHLVAVEAQSPEQIARALSSMNQESADALIVTIDSLFIQQQARIAELAKKVALPAIFASREFCEAGGS
jgi:putative ABC transport system substrate-binding protein